MIRIEWVDALPDDGFEPGVIYALRDLDKMEPTDAASSACSNAQGQVWYLPAEFTKHALETVDRLEYLEAAQAAAVERVRELEAELAKRIETAGPAGNTTKPNTVTPERLDIDKIYRLLERVDANELLELRLAGLI